MDDKGTRFAGREQFLTGGKQQRRSQGDGEKKLFFHGTLFLRQGTSIGCGTGKETEIYFPSNLRSCSGTGLKNCFFIRFPVKREDAISDRTKKHETNASLRPPRYLT
jgi:hypothetical protein